MAARPSRRTQLLAVVRKESLQTMRDKRMMAMLLVAPLLQLVVFGYAVDFNVDRIPTVIADLDQSAASRQHARELLADGTLREVGRAASVDEAEQALVRGDAAAVLVFPAGFERKLERGETAQAQVLIDGTDPNRGTVASAAVAGYFAQAGAKIAVDRAQRAGVALPRTGGISLVPRIWYNPTLASPPFMIPGVMAMLLVIVTTIVTAMGLAREREMGTLEQVLVTPIRPSVLLLGKLLPYVVIGFLDVGLALAVGSWLFNLPLRANLWLLAASTFAYLLSTLGVGLLISTVSRTQQQSFLGGFLFAMPAILLSGVMTPIRSMPGWLQAVTYLNPLRYYVEILRASLLKGAGLDDLWPRLLVLLAFGVVLLATASLRFRKRVA
jgi:ABC-2 type transport system permease protein